MKRVALSAMLALTLPGCIAQRMASSVGHPVSEVVAAFGPPTRVATIPTGMRLYEWTKRADLKAGPQPITAFRPVANGEFRRADRRFRRGEVCAYSVVARKNEVGEWIVAAMNNPSLLCT